MAVGADLRLPYDTAPGLFQWSWEQRKYISGRVTLAGGNHQLLTFREFLDAGYALLVDEYVRMASNPQGVDVMVAQEQIGVLPKKAPLPPVVAAEINEDAVARRNEDAMRELQQMMKGVAPRK